MAEGREDLETEIQETFDISLLQQCPISDMGNWVEGRWIWTLSWRRTLFTWESLLLEDLLRDLGSIQLSFGAEDHWVWEASPDGMFTVKSAYDSQLGSVPLADSSAFKILWKIAAPSNVLAFTWRVLLDRIQTKENLKKRGIIQPGQQSNCVFCHNQEESLSHLSFSCKFAWEVWSRTYKWLGIVTVQHSDANLHFLQHGNILASHSCNGWWVIWAAVVWSIWILRNDIVFNSGSACVDKIMDIIQFRSWKWLKVKRKDFTCSAYEWFWNPSLCLRVGSTNF